MLILKIFTKLLTGIFLVFLLGIPKIVLAQPLPTLKVLVLSNSPLMSYRDENGNLVGFNVELAEMLCASLKARCIVEETLLSKLFDQLAAGEADFSTVSLTITPERAKRVLFTEPYRRDRTIWISKLLLSQSNKAQVAVVNGSQQHRWAERNRAEQNWSIVPVNMNGDLGDVLTAGRADAIVAPFESAMALMKSKGLSQLGFVTRVIEADELSGTIGIAVNPHRPSLRDQLNAVIHEAKNNGQLDRLNSKYFPFRVF